MTIKRPVNNYIDIETCGRPSRVCAWPLSSPPHHPHAWPYSAVMNESCHMYAWVMSHGWTSHVIGMNASCHTCAWVMSHISHISSHTSQCITSRVHESCHTCHTYHTYQCITSHTYQCITSQSCHTYHISMYHITRINESSPASPPHHSRASLYSAVMDESCHTHEWVTSLVSMHHITHMDASSPLPPHSSLLYITVFCRYQWVMSHIWMSHVTRMITSCHTY